MVWDRARTEPLLELVESTQKFRHECCRVIP